MKNENQYDKKICHVYKLKESLFLKIYFYQAHLYLQNVSKIYANRLLNIHGIFKNTKSMKS